MDVLNKTDFPSLRPAFSDSILGIEFDKLAARGAASSPARGCDFDIKALPGGEIYRGVLHF